VLDEAWDAVSKKIVASSSTCVEHHSSSGAVIQPGLYGTLKASDFPLIDHFRGHACHVSFESGLSKKVSLQGCSTNVTKGLCHTDDGIWPYPTHDVAANCFAHVLRYSRLAMNL
jgi:hypothetical protein